MSKTTELQLVDALFKTTAALEIALHNLGPGVSGETCGRLGTTRLKAELLADRIRKKLHSKKIVIPYTLIDVDDSKKTLDAEVILENGAITINPKGYGTKCSQDGFGEPVLMELRGPYPWIAVWSDINHENPTHQISMEDARESLRKEG